MVWALHGLEVYTETADKYYYTIKVHCSTVIAKVSIAVRMVMSYMQIKHPFHTKVYDTSIVTVAYGSVPRIQLHQVTKLPGTTWAGSLY